MTAGILSERRSVPPFGLFGGQAGSKGMNLLKRSDGRVVSLGGKATVHLNAGDVMSIHTPGAGGFGPCGRSSDADRQQRTQMSSLDAGSVHNYRRLQESA
jgi:5-oxoprolinase (ATP-hydrolysing)